MVPSYLYTLYLLILATLPLAAYAAPTPAHALSLRQATDQPFDGPKTITTNRVIPVTGGSIVEDCTITFTPIVVDGQNLVREERRCSELFVPAGQQLPPPSTVSQPPPATTTTTTTTTITTTDAPPQTTQTPPPDVSTTSSESVVTTPPADTTSTTEGSTTTDVPPPVDTNTPPPAESTTESSSAPVDTPVDTPPATTPEQSAATSTGVVVLGPTSIPAENAATPPAGGVTTGTRENAEASQSAASVNIPGKEIEVLPIGLGVFAGISVIALIVVGLVTYERTKYRKAFRARRLAASGAEMGYGGMSERR